MPGRGGKRRRGQGKGGGRGGGRGGSRGRGRPTKRKRKQAPLEPEKARPAARQEESSDEESSDEEAPPTAYQRLIQSSRRDLLSLAAPAVARADRVDANMASVDARTSDAKGGGDAGDGGARNGHDADGSGSSSEDASSDDDDNDDVTGPAAADAAESTEEHPEDESDSFRRIFFGKDLTEADFTRRRQEVTDARLRSQATAGCLHVESFAVDEPPAVHRKLSDNLVRSSIRARFVALAGRSRLTEEEASVYSYMRSYCDVFHAACTHKSAEDWERLTMVHILNHVLR